MKGIPEKRHFKHVVRKKQRSKLLSKLKRSPEFHQMKRNQLEKSYESYIKRLNVLLSKVGITI